MPFWPSNKQSSYHGKRILFSKYVSWKSGWFMLFFCVLTPCYIAQQTDLSQYQPLICPQGPTAAKCVCSTTVVDCTGVSLQELPTALESSVQNFTLRNNSISTIESISSLNLTSLLYIDISCNLITSVDFSSFSSLTSLEILNISSNPVAQILAGKYHPSLKYLYIENCNFTDFGASISLCELNILHAGRNRFSIHVSTFSCMTKLKVLKLNDMELAFLPESIFSNNQLLQHIDLSNNQLTYLPISVFEGLDSLKELNLAGNPWSCDCRLLGLRLFMESLVLSGGTILDEDMTLCDYNQTTVTGIRKYDLSACKTEYYSRKQRSAEQKVFPLEWSVLCPLWPRSNFNFTCGPSNTATCVYDFTSQSYNLVQYIWEVKGMSSASTCRNQCQVNGNGYFLFENPSCLCGDKKTVAGCTDCVSVLSTSMALCNNEYFNLVGAASILYDLSVTVLPPLPEVLSKVTLTWSGGPTNYNTIIWDFGDGTTVTVKDTKSVTHIYMFPGNFNVTMTLSSGTAASRLNSQVFLQITVASKSDRGSLTCPSLISMSEPLNVTAHFKSAWNQEVSWSRITSGNEELITPQAGAANNFVSGGCGSDWIQFRGRCIKVMTAALNTAGAHLQCSQLGARLIRFYSDSEINELQQVLPSKTETQYYTGAEWSPLTSSYQWKNSSQRSFVFRETLWNASAGSCVTIATSGLAGAECGQNLQSMCEKKLVTCQGTQLGETCYELVTQEVTWHQAVRICRTYPYGQLVSVLNEMVNTVVANLAPRSVWIGLRAVAQGQYIWTNSQSLSGYSKWGNETGLEPCVSISSSGLWTAESCISAKKFVCQYSTKGSYSVLWQVAGTLIVPEDNGTLSSLSAGTQIVAAAYSALLPGSWVGGAGEVIGWNIQSKSQPSATMVALQIWRPICNGSLLAKPGCNNPSPMFTCQGSVGQGCVSSTCEDGQYFCPLTRTCLVISSPCTCAGVTPMGSINCQNASGIPTMGLIYSFNVSIPARTTWGHFPLLTATYVQEGDVIGFQAEKQDVIICDTTYTPWQNFIFTQNSASWRTRGEVINVNTYVLKKDVTCRLNLVYSSENQIAIPSNLAYVHSPGDYRIILDTGLSSPSACSVTAVSSVGGLVWVYPPASIINPSAVQINVEKNVTQILVLKLLYGTNPNVTWTFPSGLTNQSSLVSSCPLSMSGVSSVCLTKSSFLASPYSIMSYRFPSSSPTGVIKISVRNAISSQGMTVNYRSYAAITGLQFYHTNCSDYSNCVISLEVGLLHTFKVTLTSGDIENVTYSINGVFLQAGANNLTSLSYAFNQTSTYVLSVSVNNPLSQMNKSLTVQASSRAHFSRVSFTSRNVTYAMGEVVNISAIAPVTPGARLNAIWSFGADNMSSSMIAVSSEFSRLYTFRSTGNITVGLTLTDDFGDSVSVSMDVLVYRRVSQPLVFASPTYIGTYQDFNLTIILDNTTQSSNYFYGNVSYIIHWGDGSGSHSWSDTGATQLFPHVFDEAGMYTVTVNISSDVERNHTMSTSVNVTVQEVITDLHLQYDGPKHVSQDLLFMAHIGNGTAVAYSVVFGDGTSATPFQSSANFTYTYSNASVYVASITAKNLVSKVRTFLTLFAYDENLLQIIRIKAKEYVAVNTTVDISTDVAAENPKLLDYLWYFGNGQSVNGTGQTGTSVAYENIGVYNISLTAQNVSSSKSHSMSKDIFVEEPISELSLHYRSPIAINQSTENVSFDTSVTAGSNLSYSWFVDDAEHLWNFPTFSLVVNETRVYTVVVKVKNDLNKLSKTGKLLVLGVVRGLRINCGQCFSQIYSKSKENVSFSAGITYGTQVNFTWSFNDATNDLHGQVVQRTYSTPGIYLVALHAENEVSHQTISKNITVQDEVSGVNLTLSSAIVQVNSSVLLTANYMTGTDVQYTWTCDLEKITEGMTDSLTYVFATGGLHNCSVMVANQVSALTHIVDIPVLDFISSVSVTHSFLRENSTLYAARGRRLNITITANTVFQVSYHLMFNSTGQTTTVVGGPVFTISFSQLGAYTVYCNASNAISSKQEMLVVTVLEELSALTISANTSTPIYVFVGDAITFQSHLGTGSSYVSEWYKNGTALGVGDSVSVTFQMTGLFTIRVVVRNVFHSVNTSVHVLVFVPVDDVVIKLDPDSVTPYHARGANLTLSAPTVTGSNLQYLWSVLYLSGNTNFTSNSLNWSFCFNQSGIYNISLNVSNLLSFKLDERTVEIQGEITQLNISILNPVSATDFNVTFSAHINPDATNVTYSWELDGEILHTSVCSKSFSDSGLYVVSLTVANNVSQMSKQEVVHILKPVRNLTLLSCDVVEEAKTNVSLKSSLMAGTNTTFTWFVEVEEKNRTLVGQNVSFTFPDEAIYPVLLYAQNAISHKAVVCHKQIQMSIREVIVQIVEPNPDYVFQNQNVTFMVSGSHLRFAYFEWMIPAYVTYTSNSNVFVTSFPDTGNYTLMVNVSNALSRVQASLDFNVKASLCQLPGVDPVGPTNLVRRRSNSVEIEVKVDPKGCTVYLARHAWSVFRTDNCDNLTTEVMVEMEDVVTSSPALVIKPRTLALGMYCVRFVTGYHYMSIAETVVFVLHVTSSPMTAVIRGGSSRKIAQGSDFCLDGNLSFDPDLIISDSQIVYSWECTSQSPSGSCFDPSNLSRFCYRSLTPGEYLVTLNVSAGDREPGTALQKVFVLTSASHIPLASIVCESCARLGYYRISSSQHVALSASCDNCQCHPEFVWKIYKDQVKITPESQQTSTGMHSSVLVLSKYGAIIDGHVYTFQVDVTCRDGSGAAGTASLQLPANLPPADGSCSFSPTSIIPLEDQVTVTCNKWIDPDDPDSPITYTIVVRVPGADDSYPLYTGTRDSQSVYLASFSGQSVILSVVVADEFGAAALGGQSEIYFKSAAMTGNMSQTDYLATQTDTVLSVLVKQAEPTSLLQYAIALGQRLNKESQIETDAHLDGQGRPPEQSRAAIRDAVTICLSTSVPISTITDVQQMALALRLFSGYSMEYLTEDSQLLMASTLITITQFLQSSVSSGRGLDRDEVPLEDLLTVIRNLIRAANVRVYSAGEVWGTGKVVSIGDFSTDFRNLRPEITSRVGKMEFLNIGLGEAHRKALASSVVPLLEGILTVSLRTMMVREEGITLDLDGMMVQGTRSYANDIDLDSVAKSTELHLSPGILSGKIRNSDEVLQVMISHQHNPYTFGDSSLGLTMPVQTLSFYDSNGTYIKVTDLSQADSIQMFMYDTTKNLTYKFVKIKHQKNIVWQIPEPGYRVENGIGIHVQLRIRFLPNETNGTSVTSYMGVNFSPSESHHSQKLTITPALMAPGVDHRMFTFFSNDLTKSDKLYVVATNNDPHHTVELSVAVYWSSCEHFNPKTQTWAHDGCTATAASTASNTSCLCNHLTSFGGRGIVSVADLDFADLANLDLAANPVVFIAVAVIFGVYIIAVILCRYFDMEDLKRISRIPLCGRDGDYKYQISIVTGRCIGAGTTANIGLKLYGTQDKGKARNLTKPGAFHRNCHDTFIVAYDANLGDITKILVWHDNTGLSPSWYLSHIEVKDVQTKKKFTFLVNSWLSLEMDNGILQKLVIAADESQVKKFNLQFSRIFSSLLADMHTWFSVSNRPDHSRFTRVQRATCCLTSTYLYMGINAVWYGVFKSQSEVSGDLSWSSFGWEEIVIAIISTIMVLPVLLGLSVLFKRTRHRESMLRDARRPSTAKTLEIDAYIDMSRDGGSYRTVTTLGDFGPSIERESTTDSFLVGQPMGLKRTAPMNRSHRTDITSSDRPVAAQKELWSKENIMQSWPNMPDWIDEARQGAGDGRTRSLPHKSVRNTLNMHHNKSKSKADSDEDFDLTLNELDAEIRRDEKRKRSQQNFRDKKFDVVDDLFNSDDEWANEAPDNNNVDAFNLRKQAELEPSAERRKSRTRTSLRNGSLGQQDADGKIKKVDHFPCREGKRLSIVSFSSKTKSVRSSYNGRLRSLSSVSSVNSSARDLAKGPSVCVLPPWCLYVAYALCAKLCLLAVILVMWYGYRFGAAIALKWVLALCFSVFASILAVEPLKVVLLAVIARLLRNDLHGDDPSLIDIKPTWEANEQLKDFKFKPLGGISLYHAREEGKKTQRMNRMLREAAVFLVMLALFLSIVYINYHSSSMFYNNHNIQNKFYRTLDDGVNLTRLKSVSEFWLWSQTVMVGALHHRELDPVESFGQLMGPGWLRQVRGQRVPCPAASHTSLPSIKELNTGHCLDGVSLSADGDSYGKNWAVGGSNWTYTDGSQLNLYSKYGQSIIYNGGGYIQHLGLTYNESLTKLRNLQLEGWIDPLTRAVFVEFTLYHPSLDLTSSVTIVVEFPISGGILTSFSIQTEKLLRFITGEVDPLMVCQVMFLPFVIYLTTIILLNLRSEKLHFFTHLWNGIDFFIVLLAWANSSLYLACVLTSTNHIETYLADPSLPAYLAQVVLLHAIYRYLHACLIFLLCLKIVRQVRYSRSLYKVYLTMAVAAAPLMGVFLIFIILLLTYAQLGYLIYGSAVSAYSSFQNSVASLFGLMASRTDFSQLLKHDRILTPMIFTSFGFCVYGLLTALCVAVLGHSYRRARGQVTYKTTLDTMDFEMIDFMIKRFKLMIGIVKQKPAFRRVKFEGQPSLPSRTSSSHPSSRQSCNSTESKTTGKPSNAGTKNKVSNASTKNKMTRAVTNLPGTWKRVLDTFEKVENLDRHEEEITRKLERVVCLWKLPSSSKRVYNPPLGSKLRGYISWERVRSIFTHEGRPLSKTIVKSNIPLKDLDLDNHLDQQIKDHHLNKSGARPKTSKMRNHRVSPAPST
ncbi:unnamed protein product [Lymnaea stagnalis]|uniref:Polycystin-1 n=1 Tax=Lymnaea stagnalis TaxID=6523 RepID=A0AAV2HBT1_LYMST